MPVKFFADSMLGKLARWLRLLGFDTLYYPSIPDEELVKVAKKEGRVVLTKDSQLANTNKYDKLLYVASSDPDQQIKMVLKKFNLNPWKGLFSRCVYCNELVQKVTDISKFKDKIPSHTYHTTSSFYYCPACGRVYWEGSHHEKIRRKIKKLVNWQ